MSKILRVASLWNEACEMDFSKPYTPRDYMWASEIGGAFVDRFLKMTGVQPSNPPNARSRRKFRAGDIWEWTVWYLLGRAGLLIESQKECWVELPGCIRTKGKLDMLVGGKPDLDKGMKAMRELGLPEFFDAFVDKILQNPVEFERSVVEVKSCSSFMMDRYEATQKPNRHHVFQTFHYCYSEKLPGSIFYVCKDDCRMLQFHINHDDVDVYTGYENDVKNFTNYFLRNEQPPIEPLARIDDEGWWEKNWGIEYSGYLTMMYGYETPEAYRDDVEKFVNRWNRIIDRICNQKKDITKDNREGIKEMQNFISKYPAGTFVNYDKIDWINHV